MFRVGIGVAIGVLVTALIASAILVDTGGDDEEPAPTEVAADEASTHLCVPEGDEDEVDEPPSAAEPPASLPEGLFSQNAGTWANTQYDHHEDLSAEQAWCGTTIAQCGCAMTSLANVIALFGILTTPDDVTGGARLDPGTFNTWLNRDAELTAGGWISKGYFYGDVVWTDIAAFTASLHAEDPSVPTLRYRGGGSGSEEEIRSELEAGRPVILEVPGHFIAAVAIEEGTGEILILDPFYPDRAYLSQYPTDVLSSRMFEPSDDLSAILISAPGDVRVSVTDPSGRTTQVSGDGLPGDPSLQVEAGIPGSTLEHDDAWRDPTCSEREPDPGTGNWTLHLPAPGPGGYQVNIDDPDGEGTCVTVYKYDREGNVAVETVCQSGDHSFDFDYDPEPPRASITVEKTVINDEGGSATPGDFAIEIDGEPAPPDGMLPAPPGGEVTLGVVGPIAGYVVTFGGDCAEDGMLTVAPGQELRCTVTLDDFGEGESPPTVTPSPTPTEPPGGDGRIVVSSVAPSPQLFLFSSDLGSFSVTGGSSETLVAEAGTYSITQGAIPGWRLQSAGCSDPSGNSGAISGGVRVVLAAGETVRCTFTSVPVAPEITSFAPSGPPSIIACGDPIDAEVLLAWGVVDGAGTSVRLLVFGADSGISAAVTASPQGGQFAHRDDFVNGSTALYTLVLVSGSGAELDRAGPIGVAISC